MKNITRLLIVGLLIMTPFTVTGQTPALTIAEIVDIALQNNPETRTAWWRTRQASALKESTKSAYYPKISAQGNVSHGREYKFVNGPEVPYTIISSDLTLSYLLLDFGERNANAAVAEAALIASQWQNDWTLQKVMYQTIANAYEVLRSEEILRARLISLRDAQTTLDAAGQLNQSGLKSINDVYTLRTTISEMQMAIAAQKAETEIARGKLAASMGLGFDALPSIIDLPDPQAELQQEMERLIGKATECRRDLLAKRAQLDQKNAQAASVRARYLPKLNVNASTGYKRYVSAHDHGFNYDTMLSLDIPLFTGFEATYQQRAAYADVQASQAELDQLELDIALDVFTNIKQFEAAQEIFKLSSINIQNAISAYDGLLDKYKVGSLNIFELTDAQRQLIEARLKQAEAKVRWYKSLAQLAYATGTIMQYTEVPCAASE